MSNVFFLWRITTNTFKNLHIPQEWQVLQCQSSFCFYHYSFGSNSKIRDPKQGKTSKGKQGWRDKNGNIWVPAPTGSGSDHGGGHWDIYRKDDKGYIKVMAKGLGATITGSVPMDLYYGVKQHAYPRTRSLIERWCA